MASRKKLFNDFSQVDASTTREYGGTGLGLAISKKLLELMGGEVRVSSRFNEGSSFGLLLPMIVGMEPQSETTINNMSKKSKNQSL
ncbi:MAG: signal transduction histidine kinase [Polaribacter sp.]